jgi:DNA polymerase IV (DinB-like DNA polymerase)
MHRDRVIFHIDMDSFYASCELAKLPEYLDKPFVVGADPKEGHGRGVVLSCNYVARKFGIRSGMPISRAWELCREAKYVYPDHKLYGEVSQRVMTLLRRFSSRMEQISIDEAYLDFTEEITKVSGKQLEETITRFAAAIKSAIREQENITCSIGVASSKIVAKIATDLKKPDGLTIVYPDRVRDFLSPLPVGKIPGVGKVTEKILIDQFKVTTIGELSNVPVEKLQDRFGKGGIWLKNIAQGIDESEVVTHWEPVSQSGETTFEEDEEDFSKVQDVMLEVAKDVHSRVVKDGYLFRNVGIKIRFSGFETHTRSRMLNALTDSPDAINRECVKLLAEFSSSGKKVRLIGVRVSNLEKRAEDQPTLLEWT